MDDGPVIGAFDTADIFGAAAGDFSGEDEEHGGLVAFAQDLLEMFEHPQVAPKSLGGDEARDVAEDVIGGVGEEVVAVGLELVAAVEVFFDVDLPVRDAVVGELGIDVDEVGAEEAELLLDVVADGEDLVEEARGLEEAVLVVVGLVAEDVLDEMPLGHGGAHDVVEHRVVTGVAFDDAAHGGGLVGVEDGAEVGVAFLHDGRQRGGDAHVLVGENDAGLDGGGRAQGMEGGDRGLGEADVLIEIPDVIVLGRIEAEALPAFELEFAELFGVVAGHVDQEDFGRADDAGLLLDELSAAVDDPDAVGLLDLAEAGRQRGAVEGIEAGVEDFAVTAEAGFTPGVGRPEGADQDVARDLVEEDSAGEEAMEDGADAADLVDGFVSDVYDGLHGRYLHLPRLRAGQYSEAFWALITAYIFWQQERIIDIGGVGRPIWVDFELECGG